VEPVARRSIDDVESRALCDELSRRQRRSRGPQRIAEAVSQLLARQGYARQATNLEWEVLWSGIAGNEIAANCRVGNLRRGVLEIIVRNSSLLQELTFRKKQLLARVQNESLGSKVKSLRFRVGEVD
jgi:predicted nucleic acid-binding Zn ribbon protein